MTLAAILAIVSIEHFMPGLVVLIKSCKICGHSAASWTDEDSADFLNILVQQVFAWSSSNRVMWILQIEQPLQLYFLCSAPKENTASASTLLSSLLFETI